MTSPTAALKVYELMRDDGWESMKRFDLDAPLSPDGKVDFAKLWKLIANEIKSQDKRMKLFEGEVQQEPATATKLRDDFAPESGAVTFYIPEPVTTAAASAAVVSEAPPRLTDADRLQLIEYLREYLGKKLQRAVVEPLHVDQHTLQHLVRHPTENIFGKARLASLDAAVTLLKNPIDTKEMNPFIVVTSAPRQGKSRWLDELGARLLGAAETAAEGKDPKILFPIVVSYNGKTIMVEDDCKPEKLVPRFFLRTLLGLVDGDVSVDQLLDKLGYHFEATTHIDFVVVVDSLFQAKHCTKVILVDEFSKVTDVLKKNNSSAVARDTISKLAAACSVGCKLVFTGFNTETAQDLTSASGRPTEKIALPLVDHKSRAEYTSLKVAISKQYDAAGCAMPGLVYEVLKSSPGLMGYLLERLLERKGSLEGFDPWCTPWGDLLIDNAECMNMAANYFELWARGSYDSEIQSALRSMANAAVPTAVVVVGGDVFKPHPYPFVMLAKRVTLAAPRVMQCFRQICEVIERSADLMASTSAAAKLKEVKGGCFEAVVCLVLHMRIIGAEGTALPAAIEWIESFTGPASFGGDGLQSIRLSLRNVEVVRHRNNGVSAGDVSNALTAHPSPICFVRHDEPIAAEQLKGVATVWGQRCVLKHEQNGPGFDVMAILDGERQTPHGSVERGLVSIAIETKYCNYGAGRFDDETVRKLFATLCGLHRTLSEMEERRVEHQPILHFAFVILCAADCRLEADTDTLKTAQCESPFFDPSWGQPTAQTLIDALQKWGTSVSLHVVAGPDACCRFLTPVVYHILPDNEWLLNKDAAQTYGTSGR